MKIFDATETAALLPYPDLAEGIGAALLRWRDGLAEVPERTVVDVPGNGKLLVMPAADDHLAIVKVVTVHPENRTRDLPTIQGEVVVMNAHTGERFGLLEGATVTGRRTAALSLLAAQRLAPIPQGPLLVIGAGVQARSHIEAFRVGLGVKRVLIASRSSSNADALSSYARALGMDASVVDDPRQALPEATMIVTATTSPTPVLDTQLSKGTMVCAVGSFSPDIAELSPTLLAHSTVVVDTLEGARQEAGDLIQAAHSRAWSWEQVHELTDVLGQQESELQGPIVFKSVGSALFDLAAARLAFG